MSIPPPPPPPLPGTKKRDPNKTPQELVSEFWDKFFSKKPGKVTSIFPRALYATLLPPSSARGLSSARNARESYEAAAAECRERVRRIVRECTRTNEKFTDADFDIEGDLNDNCLNGLVRDVGGVDDDGAGLAVSAGQLRRSLNTLVDSNVLGPGAQVPVDIGQMRNYVSDDPWAALFSGDDTSATRGRGGARGPNPGQGQGRSQPEPNRPTKAVSKHGVKAGEFYSPGSIHRVDWIFESPQFTVDGFTASDIKQGGNGDCWWLAAVATIAHRKDLMSRVCVARDEECGVYGFVFQRDGEWISTVVDDNLYLKSADFDFYGDTYDSTGKRAREHRKRYQTGSEALYFAKCADPNETWLPLLEKAYAKVHGDYEAISGGWSGEAVEDMTGGVTTTVCTNRVLKKDKLWKELAFADGEFVFALSAIGTGWDWQKAGLALGHAYSILQAREEVDEEGNKVRLVQIRNPWGERSYNGIGEWNGPWSDGSKEWTPYWLKKLDHKFGDDGIFWMSYQDMLDTFCFMHRTRLFDERWTVVQQWTSVNIGWVSGYLNTKFLVEVKKAGMVVFVLTQLDERYFLGFEGQYEFQLHFLLQDAEESGKKSGEHICRVRPVHDWENRSVSCEVDLEPGRYEVVPKITATRDPDKKMVEDVVKDCAEKNPQKLRQVGMQYDLAHAKGGVPDEDELLVKKQEEEKAKKKAKKEKAKRKRRAEKEKAKKETLKVVMVDDQTKGANSAATAAAAAAASSQKDDEKKAAEDKKAEEKKAEEKKAEEKIPEEQKPADGAKDATKADKPADEPAKEDKKPEASISDSSTEGKPTPGSSTTSSVEEVKKPEDGKNADAEGIQDAATAVEAPVEEELEDDESDSDEEEKVEEPKPGDELEDGPPPWNAVSVVGLRVYAMDPDVSITLVKPSSPEETSSLTTDSQPAGATS